MTAFLLFIKHEFPAIWRIIDWLNAFLFRVLHGDRLARNAALCFSEFKRDGYEFRALREGDLECLGQLLNRQPDDRVEYFRPHGFDSDSLHRVFRNPSFLMFGVFHDRTLVGYFFLRCFWNQRCFVGRLIDEFHEGKGLGGVMNRILYNTAWRSKFRCLTTVSRQNSFVMRAHARNPAFTIVKELPNDYLLVEFKREKTAS
ncbi:hypothetical protein EV663_11741 [Rhodovulum bhavnagarense]|uniref:N-acetyltransferase domain-containing protein n=1 Tax=Rhodovulum bhavnagarense TaxID=992286 RepID=A0A4R2RHW8_9RHOB|nr:hypothetical protein [Rhodovulum bhavnagarense]TCP58775.1 hypothetical protein EV663_11741 [Rhodovulum bhavnagarense]